MSPSTGAALPGLPVAVDEDTVRRLCGGPGFARAEALQRAGHVLGPRLGEEGLSAAVRGEWDRTDRVNVGFRGGRLLPNCARDGPAFCRHVGALLLQWLRDPASVAAQDPDEAPGPTTGATGVEATAETESPEAELARLLDHATVAGLREIAGRRGLRAAGTKKADIVRGLVDGLAEPAGIDAALAALSPDERTALDAAHLAADRAPVPPQTISETYRALGGSGEAPLPTDGGLLLPATAAAYGYQTYVVPRLVAARLPPLGTLATRAPAAGNAPGDSGAARLGVVDLLQIVAQAAGDGELGPLLEAPATEFGEYLPAGFAVDPADFVAPRVLTRGGYWGAAGTETNKDGYPLVARRLLTDDASDRLAARTGQPPAAVEFAVRIGLELGVVTAGPRPAFRADRLRALLDLGEAERLAAFARAWLDTAGPALAGPLGGEGGPLRLHWHPERAPWGQPFGSALASAARLITRLLGRVAPDVWYDLASFVETVERLVPAGAPALAQHRGTNPGGQPVSVWAVGKGGREERLALRPPEGWNRFLTAVVATILGGPLEWLGFAEVAPEGAGGRPRAWRARRAAGVLAGRLDVASASAPAPLTVGKDLEVLVPAGTLDPAVHGFLARAGDLVGASAGGLRYRLTAAGLRRVFAAGTTGPEFVRALAERAGGTLPPAVRRTIEGWWAGYGAVRLYDELTLIELGDDLLLAELQATGALGPEILHAFSPRLVAVEPDRVEETVTALTARGYAPRLVEEG